MATTYSVGLEFSTKLNGLADAVKQLNRVDDAAKKLSGGANNIQAFSRASDAAAKSAQGLGNAAAGAAGGVKGLMGSIASLVAQLGLAVGAATLFKSSLDAAFSRDNAEQKLRNLTGSAQEYELALKMAKVAAADFGLTQTQASSAIGDLYGRLKGVGYGLKEVNEIYRGFNTVALASGVASEEAAGAFFQFSQALGKGKLNGDEFMILGERMPQLLDYIAKAAGVSRGQLSQLAQEGKLTGQVLHQAMILAGQSSGDLKGKLTAQQATMATVKQRAEEIQVQLGRAFAPAFLAVMEAFSDTALLLAAGFQALNGWVQQNREGITGFVNAALKVGALVAVVFTVVKAFEGLRWAITAAATAKAFLISLSGGGMALVAAAAGAAALAYAGLNKVLDEAGQKIAEIKDSAGAELQQIRAEIDAAKDSFSAVPEKVDAAAESTKKLKEITKQLSEETQAQLQLLSQKAEREKASLDLAKRLGDARAEAESKINAALQSQLEAEKSLDQSLSGQIDKTNEIYALKQKSIDAELNAVRRVVAYENESAQLNLQSAQSKLEALDTQRQIAESKGVETKELQTQIEAQRQVVGLAQEELRVTQEVGYEKQRAAQIEAAANTRAREIAQLKEIKNLIVQASQATLNLAKSWDQVHQGWIEIATNMGQALIKSRDLENSGKLQVQMLYQQAEAMKGIDDAQSHLLIAQAQILEQNIAIEKKQRDNAIRAGEWGQKVKELAGAYDEAAAAASRFGNIGGSGTGTLYGWNFGAAGKDPDFEAALTGQINDLRNTYGNRPNQFKQGYYNIMNGFMAQANILNNKKPPRYAEGGYVTGPQMAMIGEGGESEYVIPASKMTAAMQNYGAGKRGGAVLGMSNPQVNVSIGRSVQMDGTNYVTQQDLTRGIGSAVDQTLSLLRRDPGVRRSIGVNR